MPILSIDGQHYESEHIADPYAELDMLLTMPVRPGTQVHIVVDDTFIERLTNYPLSEPVIRLKPDGLYYREIPMELAMNVSST